MLFISKAVQHFPNICHSLIDNYLCLSGQKMIKKTPSYSGPPIVKNKAAYCLLVPLQKWPKAVFVLSSVIYHFLGKLSTGSVSFCHAIPEVLASCSLPMILCAVWLALRATECPRGGLPLASQALAGQHGVSLSLWNTPQLVPAGSWQTLSKLSFILAFCNHLLVRLMVCCHFQTSSQVLAFTVVSGWGKSGLSSGAGWLIHGTGGHCDNRDLAGEDLQSLCDCCPHCSKAVSLLLSFAVRFPGISLPCPYSLVQETEYLCVCPLTPASVTLSAWLSQEMENLSRHL